MEAIIIYLPIIMAVIGLLYMAAKKSWVLKQDAGDGKMKEISENIEAAKGAVSIPKGIGFGIKKNEDAKAAAMSSDAVIVGSALIEIKEKSIEKSSGLSSLAAFVLG